ncbi:MAG TPA: DNA-binding domain-containing protein [Burkholderiaceae bacterium]|nr:DNA-binding domain-containing protein [Burkholderiaceae bacterium]
MNEREARRQQALLAALAAGGGTAAPDLALRESAARALRGLDAYRANADAIAERTLASTFPTVRAMLGDADLAPLAAEFRRAHPPQHGDLGEWGDALPAWLDTHAGLARWPWLGDTARLDLARHRCERAADTVFEAESLGRLASDDAAQLRLVLMPGTALLRSRWPIAAIHRAHALDGDTAQAAFAELRAAIEQARAEQVLIARRGWRAEVYALDAAGADWIESLLAGRDLASALERAGAGFDFAAWLADALRAGWLKGVEAPSA